MDRRIVSYEPPEYPGAYRWPVYEYLCPECHRWVTVISGVDGKNEQGEWTPCCADCGRRIEEEIFR